MGEKLTREMVARRTHHELCTWLPKGCYPEHILNNGPHCICGDSWWPCPEAVVAAVLEAVMDYAYAVTVSVADPRNRDLDEAIMAAELRLLSLIESEAPNG